MLSQGEHTGRSLPHPWGLNPRIPKFEPGTLFLWGHNANHCTNVLPLFVILMICLWPLSAVSELSSAAQSMWRIFWCAEDCGKEQPEKHASLHTSKCDWMQFDTLVFLAYCVSHTMYWDIKSFSGILHSRVIRVLEGAVSFAVRCVTTVNSTLKIRGYLNSYTDNFK